ncbi:MAG TPA: DUF4922 domain-containing protein [Syntrophales bacterium]|nr:DUF4922 domain-containing protein [Syntrophales bacterium]
MDTPLERRTFMSFHGNGHEPALSAQCINLLEKQKASWPDLSLGYAALDKVRVKELRCNGYSVRLHHNPARMKSTTAPVDQKSINKRPCFLCLENLPGEQQGVVYRQDFIVLCNPFPITSKHYTISHVKHIPQSFDGFITAFLMMAKDFQGEFNIFYNGPGSGASAPDHLHFQAAPAGILPVEKDIQDNVKRIFKKCTDSTSLSKVKDVGRGIIIIEGKNHDAVGAALSNVISAMEIVLSSPGEPGMNLLCSYKENTWQTAIFPRRKHRPAVYFLPGDERILISPGLVEMGGIVVTPIEKDFNIVDHELVQDIYKEVSVDDETVEKVLEVAFP